MGKCTKNYSIGFTVTIILMIALGPLNSVAQYGFKDIGGFESELPSYWTIGSEPDGSTLTWATDEYRSLGRSLKISKEQTSEAAVWKSENMCDQWTPTHSADKDWKLGAFVMTQNVNTNPANDDEKWYLKWEFYDSLDVYIGETIVDIDQSVASSEGWVVDTNAVGETILPRKSFTTYMSFVGGKDATGTVWMDEYIMNGRGQLAGALWNETLLCPAGWYYWLPRTDGVVSHGYENTRLTTEEAHSGVTSLMFDLPFDREVHDAFVGAKRLLLDNTVNPGDVVRISSWIKAAELVPDSAAKYPDGWSCGFTAMFFRSTGNNAGFDVISGVDNHFKFPPVTEFDWTEYTLDVKVPEEAVAMAVRLHPYNRLTGKVYFDDLTVEKLDIPEISGIGGFEAELPSFWTKDKEPGGSTLEWATDEYLSLGRSLKISKEQTGEAAVWKSENMCDQWTPTHSADKDWKLGAFVMTQNVNTNPANDDEKWYLKWEFYDSLDVYIGETIVDIDQGVATSAGWVVDTNAVGETILPRKSFTTYMSFVGGKDATGTVWMDEYIMNGRGQLAGALWNETLLCPAGWYYWLPRTDGIVSHGYENTRLTSEEAHTGLNSLMFDLPFDREVHDAFVGAKRVPLSSEENGKNGHWLTENVSPGDVVRISSWIKAAELVPDSAAKYPDGWSCGFTAMFFRSTGNNAGFDVISGVDNHFKFPPVTDFDWTEYTLDVKVPEEAVAMAVRLHPYNRLTGKIYWDDLTVEKLDIPEISGIGGFEAELPSFWTKDKEPGGSTLTWATDEYLSLGRSLKISKEQTGEAAVWKSENMCDQWTPTHSADKDWKLGAFVKTQNVNTNPANDDEKWYLKWEFYDSLDVYIGETIVDIDQGVATSAGWVVDTNAVGETILPRKSFTTYMSFVGGKDATGTVWMDEYIMNGRGQLAGALWNETLLCPAGWYYWLPRTDGVVSHGYENTRITSEEAHTGLNSLMFDLPFDREVHDAFVGAKRVPLDQSGYTPGKTSSNDLELLNADPGDIIRISSWIKASELVPDSAARYPDGWSCGFTAMFFRSTGNNAGFDVISGVDNHFKFPPVTEFDWTEFHLDVEVPDEAVAMAVRLHPYNRLTGKIYWDDLTLKVIGKATDLKANDKNSPLTFELGNNYPNPFNPATTIEYSIPDAGTVTLEIFNILGQNVVTLVDEQQSRGRYQVLWDGKDKAGSLVGSGIYFYQLRTNSAVTVKKMILLK